MLVDLTDVLSEQHKTIETDTNLEMKEYRREKATFPIAEKQQVHIVVEYVQDAKIMITGDTSLVIKIPCDRCLEEVNTPFDLKFKKEVDLSDEVTEADEELDEKNFIEGHHLNVDQLICNEILVAWPMKVLCSEDCEGIVYKKDDALDPRMAAALDVFKNFQS